MRLVTDQVLGSRAMRIRREYGIAAMPAVPSWEAPLYRACEQVLGGIEGGRVILLEGPSGSGKSTLMRRLKRMADRPTVEVARLRVPDLVTVDCFPEQTLEYALDLLGRFGLGEVYTYLLPARQLSTGQHFRLKLALAVNRLSYCGPSVVLADEFATPLDPVSACSVARTFSRWVKQQQEHCAIVATCREDLRQALAPDLTIACDFGEFRKVA